MSLRYRFCILALAVVFVAAGAPLVGAQCVSGNVVAELQTSGPFTGLWCYTATVTWDTPSGLSNLTLDCGFGACPEQSCLQTYLFDDPAGTSDGMTTGAGPKQPCVAEYSGEFNCNGNPSIGWTDPVIKWDSLNGGCEPDKTGTGTFVFYTNLGPSENSTLPLALVKNGTLVCQGTLSGACPEPPCIVPTEETSWGKIKADYDN